MAALKEIAESPNVHQAPTGKLRPLILSELNKLGLDPLSSIYQLDLGGFPWAKINPVEQVLHDDQRFGSMASKVLIAQGDFTKFDPNTVTWLGGICSLFTGDAEKVRKKESGFTFSTIDEFYMWLKKWYPRMDQIHDTVGIPPAACKKLTYVVENSIWARKIAKWTGFPEGDISIMLKEIHESQGKCAVEAWLRNFGYRGEICISYSSDLEKELTIVIRMVERKVGRVIPSKYRDKAKVASMYSSAWLDILGLKNGVIAEPMDETVYTNPFDGAGLNKIGYLPFWGQSGHTRSNPYTDTVHRGNFDNFRSEKLWSAINFLFNTNDPLAYTPEALTEKIRRDLGLIYAIP